ncbi:MAG: hypothetical protein MK108_15610 [Mariniblastus sp.]|nr:hypothetical protein [Mariniblastus sp.]
MRPLPTLLSLVICLAFTAPMVADDPKSEHSHGPNGGAMVAVGEVGHHVELLVQGGELVTARVLDKDGQPVTVEAAQIILTFTEPDGEKEDYKVPAKKLESGESVFQRKSSHLIGHIVRDPMSVKVNVGGKDHSSATFNYPHGPNGGELVSLGKSGLHAELVVQDDAVHIHMLNKKKKPTKVDAKELTLTFTEPDGEKEDYQFPAKKGDGKGTVFERKSKHVVKHVKRDKIMVKLSVDGKMMMSKTFDYPGH